MGSPRGRGVKPRGEGSSASNAGGTPTPGAGAPGPCPNLDPFVLLIETIGPKLWPWGAGSESLGAVVVVDQAGVEVPSEGVRGGGVDSASAGGRNRSGGQPTPAEGPGPGILLEDEGRKRSLRPRDAIGLAYVGSWTVLTVAGIAISAELGSLPWVLGQLITAFATLAWFSILHEAGHGTLFATRRWNRWTGELAGALSFLPFRNWRYTHGKHHLWTGWQDRDVTTAALVPRELRRSERWLVNVCWALWIPLFALLYRVNNYWNVARIAKHYSTGDSRRRRLVNSLGLHALLWCAVLALVGPASLFVRVGLGLYVGMALQDLLILSQHTHVPMGRSDGAEVRPWSPKEQARFTRSLKLPSWLSLGLLVGGDAHELHHAHPEVPGYRLARLGRGTAGEVPAFRWILAAKLTPAHRFLLSDRERSGLAL